MIFKLKTGLGNVGDQLQQACHLPGWEHGKNLKNNSIRKISKGNEDTSEDNKQRYRIVPGESSSEY